MTKKNKNVATVEATVETTTVATPKKGKGKKEVVMPVVEIEQPNVEDEIGKAEAEWQDEAIKADQEVTDVTEIDPTAEAEEAGPEGETAEEKEIRLGRPVDPNSNRQAKLAKYAEKEAAGIPVKRGRPSDPNSERAKRLAKQAARKEAGLPKHPGRPKVEKPVVEVVPAEPVAIVEPVVEADVNLVVEAELQEAAA